jgi:hypothetical protein
MRAEDFPNPYSGMASISGDTFRTRGDDELTAERLAWCKQQAEEALEVAAEKLFGEESAPESKDAIRSESRIAPEVTKTAANTISARSVAENGPAASQEGSRYASL